MRTIRIHVELPLAVGLELGLPAQAGEHVARVLRLTAGSPITLFNGDGMDYPAVIQAVGKRDVNVRVEAAQPGSPVERFDLLQGKTHDREFLSDGGLSFDYPLSIFVSYTRFIRSITRDGEEPE